MPEEHDRGGAAPFAATDAAAPAIVTASASAAAIPSRFSLPNCKSALYISGFLHLGPTGGPQGTGASEAQRNADPRLTRLS